MKTIGFPILIILMIAWSAQSCRVGGSMIGDGPAPDAPALISYDNTSLSYFIHSRIDTFAPTIEGEELTFSISPDLPTGLSIDASTGAISGTPIQYIEQTTFTITAANESGSVSTTIDIATRYGFVVSASGDDADATTDGVCETAGNECTLRAAINEANQGNSDNQPYRIEITANSILLTAQLLVTGEVEIVGALNEVNSTTISAGNTSRHFSLQGNDFTLRDVSLTNGSFTTGGCILIGDNLTATIDSVNFVGCTGTGRGGAIAIAAAPTSAVLNVSDSYFNANTANNYGGAISARAGTVNIDRCFFESNVSTNNGGGAIATDGTADITIRQSAFNDNHATGVGTNGGAILHDGDDMVIENTTIHDNEAGGSGGALQVDGAASAVITFSTLTGNSASLGNSGGALSGTGNYTIGSSIMASNTTAGADNCSLATTVTSSNYNISDTTLADCADLTKPQDQVNTAPMLQSFSGNPIPTRSPNVGSPAIDQVPAGSCPATDARGIARPQGATCDIGAHEVD